MDWRLTVKEHIANIGIPLDFFFSFSVSMNLCVYNFFLFFGSLRTRLLCLLGEIAEEGSVAVAVAVSER